MHSRRTFPCAAACLGVLLWASAALGQLPAAKLFTLFPPGARSGATIDVNATGEDLDDADEIHFSHPGITAKAADDEQGMTTRRFKVSVAADVPAGVYEARVVGQFGVSNPRAFVVGRWPETIGKPGSAAASAAPMVLATNVNGWCTANQIDYYAIDLCRGKRVLIDCMARQIDSRLSPVMTLTAPDGREVARSRRGGLIDFMSPGDGRYVLALHDLTYRGGPEYFYRLSAGSQPHLDAIFPPAGEPGSKGKYMLYGRNLPGGKEAGMRGIDGAALQQLEVEIELPKADADINASAGTPAGDASAQHAQRVRKTLLQHEVGGQEAPLDVPPIAWTSTTKPDRFALAPDAAGLLGTAGAGIEAYAYRLNSDAGPSNPILIGLARAPVSVEREPNETPDKAQKVSPPCEIVGRFYPHDDVDCFTFDAGKGEVYWIEVFSQRMGLPTSPALQIQRVTKNAKGDGQVSDIAMLGGPDAPQRSQGFDGALRIVSPDPVYRLEAGETATYRLTLRDLFNTARDNPALIYRLSIHKQLPDFALLATTAAIGGPNANKAEPTLGSPFLRKSGVTPIRIMALREEGFDGEITIEAHGLPDGVHCVPIRLGRGANATTLLFTADDGAGPWAGPVRLIGKAMIAGKERAHRAKIESVVWPGNADNTEPPTARVTDQLPLAVSGDEAEPLSIAVTVSSLQGKAGSRVKAPVKVTRRLEMKQPLKLKAAGLPGLNNPPELTIAPGADTGVAEFDIPAQLAPGPYTFYLEGQTQFKYERAEPSDAKPAKGDKKKQKKKTSKDAQVTFYSPAISVTVLPK